MWWHTLKYYYITTTFPNPKHLCLLANHTHSLKSVLNENKLWGGGGVEAGFSHRSMSLKAFQTPKVLNVQAKPAVLEPPLCQCNGLIEMNKEIFFPPHLCCLSEYGLILRSWRGTSSLGKELCAWAFRKVKVVGVHRFWTLNSVFSPALSPCSPNIYQKRTVVAM